MRIIIIIRIKSNKNNLIIILFPLLSFFKLNDDAFSYCTAIIYRNNTEFPSTGADRDYIDA